MMRWEPCIIYQAERTGQWVQLLMPVFKNNAPIFFFFNIQFSVYNHTRPVTKQNKIQLKY